MLTSVLLIWTLTFTATASLGPKTNTKGDGMSGDPRIEVRGASPTEEARMMLAISRFDGAGLTLPDLLIRFAHEEDERCHGHAGLFEYSSEPWRISICDGNAGWVYEHELAHAWERANLDDEVRQRFMELRGFSVWTGSHVSWNHRGAEGVALIVQQGLSGLPLPPALSDDQRSRLEAYRLVTGQPDPRLDDWQDLHGGGGHTGRIGEAASS
jgi:hypothetical protein